MGWANLKKHLEGKCDGMFEKLPYKTKAGEEKHCLQAVKKYANTFYRDFICNDCSPSKSS